MATVVRGGFVDRWSWLGLVLCLGVMRGVQGNQVGFLHVAGAYICCCEFGKRRGLECGEEEEQEKGDFKQSDTSCPTKIPSHTTTLPLHTHLKRRFGWVKTICLKSTIHPFISRARLQSLKFVAVQTRGEAF